MIKKTLMLVLVLSVTFSVGAADSAPPKKKTGILGLLKKEDKDPKPSKTEAEDLTKTLTTAQKTKLMEIVNKGDEAALTALPGIGATKAAAIKKARPIAQPSNLVDVDGISTATIKGIVEHAKAGFPAPTVVEKKAASKKGATKPAAKTTAKTEPSKTSPANKSTPTKAAKGTKSSAKSAAEESAKKKAEK